VVGCARRSDRRALRQIEGNEVVDVVRAQVDLERIEDVADVHPQSHALGPVDVEVEPGGVGPAAAEEALQAPRAVAPGDDLVADPLQFVEAEVAAVFDDELEAPRCAQAVDRRRAEHGDDRPGDFALAALLDTLAQARGEIGLGLIQVYRSLGGGWQLRLNGCEPPPSPPPGIPPPAETASPFADFKPAETSPSLPSVEQPTPHARPLVPDVGASPKPLGSRSD
jgi:hypothetical protein